jgi:hypothetical protein
VAAQAVSSPQPPHTVLGPPVAATQAAAATQVCHQRPQHLKMTQSLCAAAAAAWAAGALGAAAAAYKAAHPQRLLLTASSKRLSSRRVWNRSVAARLAMLHYLSSRARQPPCPTRRQSLTAAAGVVRVAQVQSRAVAHLLGAAAAAQGNLMPLAAALGP